MSYHDLFSLKALRNSGRYDLLFGRFPPVLPVESAMLHFYEENVKKVLVSAPERTRIIIFLNSRKCRNRQAEYQLPAGSESLDVGPARPYVPRHLF
jgi:hypothetical protein